MASILCKSLRNIIMKVQENAVISYNQSRNRMGPPIKRHYDLDQPDLPKPSGKFRRLVHYPEEYTVEPLQVTRLGGRDPESGRKVVKGIGGGIKYKYHWISWKREGPKDNSPPLVEKVIQIMDDFSRTAKIALVAGGKEMKYYLATENMKPGDLIRTSQYIPRSAVAANEGDAYPLGALPIGTKVHCVQRNPKLGGYYAHAAGTCAILLRRLGDKVVIQLPSKIEVALPKENMAVVGRLSNIDHHKIPIGSAQRNRELGNRPRSGWWQRKTGRFGRKIRPPPPVKIVDVDAEEIDDPIILTLDLKRTAPLVI